MALRFMKKRATTEQNPPREAGKLSVDLRRCPQNHPCPSVRICPTGALSQRGFAAPVVDEDQCISCGKCVSFCPKNALALG